MENSRRTIPIPSCSPSQVILWIEHQAKINKDRPAISIGREEMTYNELNRLSNQFAGMLIEKGMCKGQLIGLCLGRSHEMIVASIGALKAGCSIVPLDPDYPRERIAYMATKVKISMAVCSEQTRNSISDLKLQLLSFKMSSLAHLPYENFKSEVNGDDAAYVLFTSGSTGQPKAVIITHLNLDNLVETVTSRIPIKPDDSYLHFASFNFVASVRQTLLPLCNGAKLIVATPEERKSPELLLRSIQDHGVSILDTTPSHLAALIDHLQEIDAEQRLSLLNNKLRLIMSAGEPLPLSVPKVWHAHFKHPAKFVNTYGQTETTGCVCISGLSMIDDASRSQFAYMPIGTPNSKVGIHLLDEMMKQVPSGEIGELFISGPSVTRGYLDDPAQNSEKYVELPLPNGGTVRACRTGDRVRSIDGLLHFAGRSDGQIKIRGIRVEPGEIEMVLEQHAKIFKAAVVGKAASSGKMRLIAYVEPVKGQSLTKDEIKSFLSAKLPDYMMPAITPIEKLPLTPNGKKDRVALTRIVISKDRNQNVQSAPSTSVEKHVGDIFKNLLELESIEADENFFDIGGDSLSASGLRARILSKFGIDLPPSSIQKLGTVAKISAEVIHRSGSEGARSSDVIKIVPDLARRHERFPLNEIQGAYFLARSTAETAQAAHRYVEIQSENFDLVRFEKAWQCMIDRHDTLRSTISSDGYQQILHKVPQYKIHAIDATGLSDSQADSLVLKTRERLSKQVFPTDHWPLFEVLVHRLGQGKARIQISIDFLICDGMSFRILLFELAKAYQFPDAPFASLKLSFRDVVLARNQYTKTLKYKRSLAYWLERLPQLPPPPGLPVNPNDTQKSLSFKRRSHILPQAAWETIKERATNMRITATCAVMTAYAEILGTWSKSQRFTLNLTTLNRPPWHPEINDLVGDFTSVSLLGIELRPNATFEEHAQAMQTRLWENIDHDDVDGIVLLRELARSQTESVSSGIMPFVFTSMLNIHHSSGTEILKALNGHFTSRFSQTPQVLIDHQIYEEDGALVLSWDSADSHFPTGMLDDMFKAYVDHLNRLAGNLDSWASSATLVPVAQQQLLREVNSTGGAVSKETLYSLFSKQAEKTPDSFAILSNRRTLSYRELWQMANNVASVLVDENIYPKKVVAVVMEKGWEQAVAALGILQNGCAYLPIDATVPKERLWHLLQQTEATMVLTQSKWLNKIDWPGHVKTMAIDSDHRLEGSRPMVPSFAKPEDLAYILYTSGSTGEPKGVAMPHRGPVNTILHINDLFKVGPKDRAIALSAMNFDLSVWDLYGCLAAGAALVFPDPEGVKDPSHWLQLLKKFKITLWNTVPALMQMLVDYIDSGDHLKIDDLRLVLQSGDWIPVPLPDRIRKMARNAHVISVGGPTETSIWSSYYAIGKVEPEWKSIPYGKPLRNQTCHILNDSLQSCPLWVPGEIYVGGLGLADGYWKNPEKTNATFIVHPQTGERLYKSGDLGRYTPNGNVEFLGREDFQVKIQGYRIELGEIETTLEKNPNVKQVVVAVHSAPAQVKSLIAYIVPMSAPQNPDTFAKTLKSEARKTLPDYMVPSQFVVLEKLPLTANGKVDRSSLRKFDMTRSETTLAVVNSKSPLEAQIEEIWREVLEVRRIEPADNFFELGGNSIKLILSQRQLRKKLGIEIPVAKLFQLQNIKELAFFIQGMKGIESGGEPTANTVKLNNPAWIKALRTTDKAKAHIFCFHHAGGSAHIFQNWTSQLTDDFDLFAVQLPGRSERSHETPVPNVGALAREISAAIKQHLYRPYIFVGFSFGATLAFEVARELRRQNTIAPIHFVTIAGRPVGQPLLPLIHGLPDLELLETLNKRLGGQVHEELLKSPETLSLIMPALRADIEALETYVCSSEEPFDFAMTAFIGTEELSLTPELLKKWSEHTTSKLEIISYVGGHFFPDPREDVKAVATFTKQLTKILKINK